MRARDWDELGQSWNRTVNATLGQETEKPYGVIIAGTVYCPSCIQDEHCGKHTPLRSIDGTELLCQCQCVPPAPRSLYRTIFSRR